MRAASNSRRHALGDYFALQRGTTYKSRLLGQPGPILLGLATIHRNGGFRSDSVRTYGGDSPDKLLVKPGELYVSLKDVTQSADLLGAVARLPLDQPAGRLTQDTVKLIPRSNDVPVDYLYWLLRTPAYRSFCRAHATGTTNLGLPREDFLKFPVPRLDERRRRLTQTLGVLDDKIELNCRMNETLEAMARAAFKSWFIDPASDRSPSGWRESTIGDEVRVVGGSTPSTGQPEFWDGGSIHWATPKDLAALSSPVLLETERRITENGLAQIGSGLLPAGTVLLSSRAPIGYLAISEVPAAINQGFIAMVCEKVLPPLYLWLWAAYHMDEIKGRANGTTFQEISKGNFKQMPISVPPHATLALFRAAVGPLHRRIVANVRESRTLAALRDALLPELILGRLRAGGDPFPGMYQVKADEPARA